MVAGSWAIPGGNSAARGSANLSAAIWTDRNTYNRADRNTYDRADRNTADWADWITNDNADHDANTGGYKY